MFKAEPEIHEHLESYSQQAMQVADEKFGLELSAQIECLPRLDGILDLLRQAHNADPFPDDQLDIFMRLFGAHLGEVIRNRHGGEWGVFDNEEGEETALNIPEVGVVLPFSIIHNRITDGEAQSTSDYYHALTGNQFSLVPDELCDGDTSLRGASVPERVTAFTPKDHYDQVAKAYAFDAVEVAKRNFLVDLDWSLESIRLVEEMLDRLNEAIETQKPSDKELEVFSKMFGSYIGEVVRRKHGGSWGVLEADGTRKVGLSYGIFPWANVFRRIIDGPSENVWEIYETLIVRGE